MPSQGNPPTTNSLSLGCRCRAMRSRPQRAPFFRRAAETARILIVRGNAAKTSRILIVHRHAAEAACVLIAPRHPAETVASCERYRPVGRPAIIGLPRKPRNQSNTGLP